ncbi:MAG TPA: MBL fold metallo-hydrolase [Gammaproteobacteria bacterium]|nr:MBL fold metallo-hydrolase [Gammaproteobacteria bacterium]
MRTLTFSGAAGQVTGSCHVLEWNGRHVLLDCGLYQGDAATEAWNERPFPVPPDTVDAVVLSHAHLDHSGLLPRLVRDGFRHGIFATRATADLLQIMLRDAAHLQEREAEWARRHRDRRSAEPLYRQTDVDTTLTRITPVSYREWFDVVPGVRCRYRDAGHILGSAIVEVDLADGADRRRLVFSGDLGNRASPLLRDPELPERAELLLLESTYGDRDHRPMAETLDELETVLAGAADNGGNVLIPSFAVGRSQEILFRLGELYQAGRLKQQMVFLDSPMAIAATRVYDGYQRLYNSRDRAEIREAHAGSLAEWLPPLRYSHTPEDSMAINRIAGGAIVIAGSGMCNGGRIRHHLRHNLQHRATRVVIVGFQARGTPGRALVDGARSLCLFGEEVPVNASIHTLGGFSAHAGQTGLVEWASAIEGRPSIHLVHGEPDRLSALAAKLRERTGRMPGIAERGQVIAL